MVTTTAGLHSTNVLLEHVHRVSGPVSAFVFDLPTHNTSSASRPHRIYIFGDVHFSYANTCRGCSSDPACITIMDFVDRLAASVQVGNIASLDVHVELPLLKGVTRPGRLKAFDAFIRQNASTGRRAKAAAAEKATKRGGGADAVPSIVGIISLLYHKYGQFAYHVQPSPIPASIRFHADDARDEENARVVFHPSKRTIDSLLQFHTRLPTAADVMILMRVFLFSEDFVGDLARLLPAVKPVLSALTHISGDRYVHKIATQFLKLPTTALRERVRSFVEVRLTDLETLLRRDLAYDDAAQSMVSLTSLASLASPKSGAAIGRKSKQTKQSRGPKKDGVPTMDEDLARYAYSAKLRRLRAYLSSAFSPEEGVFNLPLRTLLMDTYLLCRMLRFAYASPGGVSIAYTGDRHSAFYVTFLRHEMKLAPVVCHVRRATTPSPAPATVSARAPGFSRCVPIQKPCPSATALSGDVHADRVERELDARSARREAFVALGAACSGRYGDRK